MDEASPPAIQPDERPSIRLDNVLKLAGIAETGGQAKRMIQAGEVRVNGAVEAQGETFVVELTSEDELEDDMDDVVGDRPVRVPDDALSGATNSDGADDAPDDATYRPRS